jgi:2-keto-4-pentenoate hydratase/2-oxohepta-3-ene-1,7-dioic acid hydratase in catechol pathway
MAQLYLATIAGDSGPALAAVRDGRAHTLAGGRRMRDLLSDWERALEDVAGDLDAGRLGEGTELDSVRFLPPVLDPPNLYMVGANYADHAREMRKLPPGTPIEPPPAGPFFFLKPTTTLIGHRAAVLAPPEVKRLDWEVELAAVIGTRAHRVPASGALAHVAAYTVINDVSARDHFVRDGAEPAMTFDWVGQKGWHTSCPAGPWLLPASDCPDPGALDISLTVNGEVMQSSNTREMIFSLAEQIAHLSRIVPLEPGDIISTGTCAGTGRAETLHAGDVMVATVELIGSLENPVQAEES